MVCWLAGWMDSLLEIWNGAERNGAKGRYRTSFTSYYKWVSELEYKNEKWVFSVKWKINKWLILFMVF